MQVLIDGVESGHEHREMEALPRVGEDIKINDEYYNVAVVTWYPDEDGPEDVILEVDRIA